MTSVLFVCTGNICRSPSAEGVLRHVSQLKNLNLVVDSAGTHAYHVGEKPDPRSQTAAHNRGIDISALRARKFRSSDFEQFDYILVMDSTHYSELAAIRPDPCRAHVNYFMSYTPKHRVRDIPDPYYGGIDGFEYTLDLIELAAAGFIAHLYPT